MPLRLVLGDGPGWEIGLYVIWLGECILCRLLTKVLPACRGDTDFN